MLRAFNTPTMIKKSHFSLPLTHHLLWECEFNHPSQAWPTAWLHSLTSNLAKIRHCDLKTKKRQTNISLCCLPPAEFPHQKNQSSNCLRWWGVHGNTISLFQVPTLLIAELLFHLCFGWAYQHWNARKKRSLWGILFWLLVWLLIECEDVFVDDWCMFHDALLENYALMKHLKYCHSLYQPSVICYCGNCVVIIWVTQYVSCLMWLVSFTSTHWQIILSLHR